ncbi:hypothetical protein SLOPH_2231 [Spraguea lophii 42_110]|uniref:Uncharacterized protein n=1 Tax=Spraguea lophii (strain 42_110) TaxID=1358809 RepID=S7WDN3_SPRLO|nr:hypothetical protein SLOPH_2231 [Spraguea lophii 42_110]
MEITHMRYFDLHDIIAEETMIETTFSIDKSLISEYIIDDHINLYYLKFLLENDHCSVINPLDSIRNELLAKADIVNVNNKSKEFFLLLTKLDEDEVFSIFADRASEFLKYIFLEDFNDDDQVNMDIKEKELYIKARKKYMEYNNFHKIFKKE